MAWILLALALPLTPLLSLLLLRSPPAPRGAFAVGFSDAQQRVSLPGVDADPTLRLRIFYPALPAPKTSRRGARGWLTSR